MPDDTTPATVTTAETPPSTATTPTAPAALTDDDLFAQAADRLAAAASEDGEPTEATPAQPSETEKPKDGEAKPKDGEPKPGATNAESLDAADEALFADDALKTPAGVKAAADRLRALRTEQKTAATQLVKRQEQVDHDFRVLKQRERKFETTRGEHLAWHAQQRDQARLLGHHVQVLRTGTPAQVIESLGFLTGQDGMAFYEQIVKNAAGLRKAPDPELEALRAEQRALREELQRERDQAKLDAETRHKREAVEARKAQLLETAKDATKYPTLAQYASMRPKEVIAELVNMKREWKAETGESLSDEQAVLQLESNLALLLRRQGGGAGSPRPEEGQNPGGKSSSQSSPAQQTSGVAGIPPSASARVAPVRQATEEELQQELTPEFYSALGLF